MAFEKIEEITPTKIKAFRESRGVKQKFFWNSLGILGSRGSRIERGISPITKDVRLLIFLYYSDAPEPRKAVQNYGH